MATVRRLREVLGVDGGPAAGLLLLCWTTTVLLVLAYVGIRHGGTPTDVDFRLGRDRGYGETFFVLMTVWVGLQCLVLARRLRAPMLVAWAAAFGVLLVDDWFTLHETFGPRIGRSLGVPGFVGELVWLGGTAVVVGVVLGVAHLTSRGPARVVSLLLFGLSAALMCCGVVLDALHALVEGPAWKTLFTVLEDGGEIAVMSLVLCFLFAVTWCGHRPVLGGRWKVAARDVVDRV